MPNLLGTMAVLAVLGVVVYGCAGGAYQSRSSQESYYPAQGAAVPPSFYDNDPALEHWYTPPYWNPDAGP